VSGSNGRARRPHDDAGYRQRRKLLMASVTPATRCGRCGKLAHEHPLHANGRPGHWQAGHTVDGNNLAPLIAEWSTCNQSAGGRLGNQRRWGSRERPAPRSIGPHHPMHYNLDDPAALTAPPCVRHGAGLCPTCAEWRARNPTRNRG
jgi:hypothetical protein